MEDKKPEQQWLPKSEADLIDEWNKANTGYVPYRQDKFHVGNDPSMDTPSLHFYDQLQSPSGVSGKGCWGFQDNAMYASHLGLGSCETKITESTAPAYYPYGVEGPAYVDTTPPQPAESVPFECKLTGTGDVRLYRIRKKGRAKEMKLNKHLKKFFLNYFFPNFPIK